MPRGVRAQQHRLVVDRDDPLAAADLIRDEVLEQVGAHRAQRVRAEALALAGHVGGHEVERVQLGVRVVSLGVLVDAEVHVGRARHARASARASSSAAATTSSTLELGERTHGVRGVLDDLVRAARRERARRGRGCPAAAGRARRGQQRLACAGAVAARRPVARRRDDRAQAGQRVDAELGALIAARSARSRRRACLGGELALASDRELAAGVVEGGRRQTRERKRPAAMF